MESDSIENLPEPMNALDVVASDGLSIQHSARIRRLRRYEKCNNLVIVYLQYPVLLLSIIIVNVTFAFVTTYEPHCILSIYMCHMFTKKKGLDIGFIK